MSIHNLREFLALLQVYLYIHACMYFITSIPLYSIEQSEYQYMHCQCTVNNIGVYTVNNIGAYVGIRSFLFFSFLMHLLLLFLSLSLFRPSFLLRMFECCLHIYNETNAFKCALREHNDEVEQHG